MFKNYLQVTFRSLRRSGTYSLINMAGLSIGIACTLLIFLWVFDELSFNEFVPKSNRLSKVVANVTYDGKVNTWTAVALPAYDVLKTESTHIANTCAVSWPDDHLLAIGEKKVNKTGHYATEEFLSMFEYPLVSGDRKTALNEPGSIVISAALARTLFGEEDPMNKLVRLDNLHEQKVTGVFADLPSNSSFHFDCLIPWRLYESDPWIKTCRTSWDSYSFGVYVELDDPASLGTVQAAIKDVPGRFARKDDAMKREFALYPMTQWRLYSQFQNGIPATGAIEYVQLFSIIGIFILVMACINFMNLATARSEQRAKEVGIRKSVGSSRRDLVIRFIGESLVMAFLSTIIAVLLAEAALPFYNKLVQKQLFIDYWSSPFWILTFGLIFFTGLLAGSYPAFYLSSFRPVKVLKGKTDGKGGSTPRKILVTLQFGFSIIMLIGTVVVYRQLEYVKSRDLGYDKENLITIKLNADIKGHYQVIKDELLRSGAVKAVTKSNSDITSTSSYGFLSWPGMAAGLKVLFVNVSTEYDYTKTLGISLLEGRDFSEEFKNDTSSVLINKAALDVMGLKDPIGQKVSLFNGRPVEVIGILPNTVMGPADEAVAPTFVQFVPTWFNCMMVRLEKTNDLPGNLKKVEGVIKKFSPAYPFEYKFVDVEFQKKYTDIILTARLANLFSGLAIFITGLGLFGLASFMAEQRTRELGIRKVLGASVTSLVALMSVDFSRMVALAFLLAAPAGWWMLNKFLEKYEYRTGIPWWIFPLTGLVTLGFAILIVGTQALRAARANPVNSLRSE